MTIVAAVDGSQNASNVVEQGAKLAEAFGEPLHVVHVMSESEFETKVHGGSAPTDAVTPDEIKAEAADRCHDAARDVDTEYEAVGLVGDKASRILAYADSHDARYVVIGTRKRTPTGKALFGSVSQSILLQSNRPVVSVGEADF